MRFEGQRRVRRERITSPRTLIDRERARLHVHARPDGALEPWRLLGGLPSMPGYDARPMMATCERAMTGVPNRVLWVIAAVFGAIEIAVSGRYGFHRDELYFLAAGQHLAFGYVDQGPLAPLIARVSVLAFGRSPTAIRIIPALAGAGVVFASGLIAETLGGGSYAQGLAAVATAAAPVLLGASHLAGTTVYDLLAWTLVILFVLKATLLDQSRCWLWAGLLAGIGLENKNLLLLLFIALGIALVACRRWEVLRSRWLWAGVGIAALLWLPNGIWQAANGFPSLTISRALQSEHSSTGDYASDLPAQLIYIGLLAVPLAIVGIRYLARRRELRFLAIAAGLILAFVFTEIPGRPYYVDGFMPLLFAAGVVAVESRARGALSRRAWIMAPAIGGVLTLVLVLPVLPLATFAKLRFMHKLNYDLGETVGWPQLVAVVDRVYDAIPPQRRHTTSIFTGNYGEAGAIAWYGPADGLPTPLSGHNNYSFWGPGTASDATVIALDSVTDLHPYFAHCGYDTTFRSPLSVNNDENGAQIWTCTQPRGPWRSFWPKLRHYN
jgi:Dolichyl-phosphate-mannose-protein mannosyltransferase